MTETSEKTYTRFSLGQRIEHFLLIISFTVLGLTGVPQKYAGAGWAETLIAWMGGIEMVRWLHHAAAVVLILESCFHIVVVIYRIYVQGARFSDMLPALKDIQDFFAAIAYNLGLRRERPLYGRYSFDEKIEYWAVIWGTAVMIVTGFMLWNPIATTKWLPGEFIPAAKAAHGGEALLAILSIIIWHLYNVHIKHFNKSMFTGKLTHEEMVEDHPLELARIEAGMEREVPEELAAKRRRLFIPVAGVLTAVFLFATYWFVTLEVTAITTVPPQPTAEVFQRAIPRVTPTPERVVAAEIPHTLVDHENCRQCHARGTLRPFPEDHQGYGNELCLNCHQLEAGAEQVAAVGGEVPSFRTDIEPALEKNCTVCHGVAGGLNLSGYSWLMAGGHEGPAVVPGWPERSLIIQVLESGHFAQLPDDAMQDLRKWIRAGAPNN